MAGQAPGRLVSNRHAVRVGVVESLMLGHPEGKSVHSHLARPRPLSPARVIARSLQLYEAGGEVRQGVAADDDRLPRPGPNCAIEIEHNLSSSS